MGRPLDCSVFDPRHEAAVRLEARTRLSFLGKLPVRQRLRARARELAVEWRDINGLVPYARNARTHAEDQIAQIAGSIREFGFTNPVLIDPEGGIFGQFTSLPASMIRPPSPTR